MSWVDDRINDQRRSADDLALIRQKSETVYGELWNEISNRVADARSGGMTVTINGSDYARAVLVGGDANIYRTRPYESRQLTITLDKADGKIVATDSGGESRELPLGVDKGNIVRPTYEGKPLTIPDAAKMILEPFLFPPAV